MNQLESVLLTRQASSVDVMGETIQHLNPDQTTSIYQRSDSSFSLVANSLTIESYTETRDLLKGAAPEIREQILGEFTTECREISILGAPETAAKIINVVIRAYSESGYQRRLQDYRSKNVMPEPLEGEYSCSPTRSTVIDVYLVFFDKNPDRNCEREWAMEVFVSKSTFDDLKIKIIRQQCEKLTLSAIFDDLYVPLDMVKLAEVANWFVPPRQNNASDFSRIIEGTLDRWSLLSSSWTCPVAIQRPL